MSNKKSISFKADARLVEEVQHLAKKERRSVSSWVLIAIEERINRASKGVQAA